MITEVDDVQEEDVNVSHAVLYTCIQLDHSHDEMKAIIGPSLY